MKEVLEKINNQVNLSMDEMQDAMNQIMSGKVNDIDMESFLIGLNIKGISEEEITAAAIIMREKSLQIDIGDGSHIDTCGTGGTGLHTFNCSTASSFVAAAGGAKITKHGNKAISSKSGSADFLEEAGANINHDRSMLDTIFSEIGFVFLFAPLHHQAMKYVMPVRQKIAAKTIFNLLGPHTNPCNSKRQLLGVYDKNLLSTFSHVAKNLDMEHVLVVHGDDGLDEISVTSETSISELKDMQIKEYKISPINFGLDFGTFEAITAQSSEESLKMVNEAFAGTKSSIQDMIALNAGAALYIANKAISISDGVELAFDLMNSGKAAEKLNAYVNASNNL